jgi:hypothetical protein
MREGTKFPEVQKVIDVYKNGINPIKPVEGAGSGSGPDFEPEQATSGIPKPDPGDDMDVPSSPPNTNEKKGAPSER